MSDSERNSSAPDFQPLGTTASLRMRGAVSSGGAVALKAGQLIDATSVDNRFGGTVSLEAGGRITLNAGTEGTGPRARCC